MVAPFAINTLVDLRERLGGIPLDRIRFRPAPGTATEKDVIEAEARDNRLYELVDGTLVEKAVGFEEARLAARLVHLVNSCFEAGVIVVWLIDPKKRTARVFSGVDKSTFVRADQSLDGGDVLPGFVVPLADFLDRGRRPRRG
jgi:hypothetical protein